MFNDRIWRLPGLHLSQYKKRRHQRYELETKEIGLAEILLEYEQRQPLDDIPQAAITLASKESLARYHILTSTYRNHFCNSGIKGIVQQGEFQELGERIIEDKRSLEVIFRDRPDERNEMRRRMKFNEKECCFELWFEKTRNGQRWVYFNLSHKGNDKMRSMLPLPLESGNRESLV